MRTHERLRQNEERNEERESVTRMVTPWDGQSPGSARLSLGSITLCDFKILWKSVD